MRFWSKKHSVQNPKRRWLGALLLVLLAIALYGAVIEPRWVDVHRFAIPLQRLPREFDGVTVAQLTDIHYLNGLDRGYFQRIVETTNRLHPDLILLTGDYITRDSPNIRQCTDALSRLHAPLGVYAVFGNHDFSFGRLPMIQAMKSAGITILSNKAISIQKKNARLWIVGLEDVFKGFPNINTALRGVPTTDANILLVHEPDYADTASRYPIDLQLSGHSHGGLVWLPFVGAPYLPEYSRQYPRGLYRIGGLSLYTSRGLGVIPVAGIPMRLNARPEIPLITLRAVR